MSVDGDRIAALAERRAALGPGHAAAMRERLRRAATFAGSGRIRPRTSNGPIPLSFAQQRLWFLDQLVPQNPFYNIPARLPLGPVVDHRALERAVSEIVRRHEALRTTFTMVDGNPVQVVATTVPVPLTVVDLRHAPADDQRRLVEDEARREARRPFDLAVGPLVRTTLVRTTTGSDLLLTMHHIVSDGWSIGVFLRELMTAYGAFARGQPSPLPDLAIQYPDFAIWQREHLTGETLAGHIAYWRKVLRGLPRLELPTDFARPAMPSFCGDNVPVRLPRDVSASVRALAAELGATPFMVLLAGYATLLHRVARQDAIAIGVPIANRTEPQLEPLIGFFVNSLALRIDVDGATTVRELVAQVRETALGAYAHQDMPFERLVDELQPERDLSRNPLAQVTIQLQNAPTATGELPDDDAVLLDPSPGTAIVDIALSLWETTGSFVGMAQYSTDLFERATIEGFVDTYVHVVRELVGHPDAPVNDLALAPLDEDRSWPRTPSLIDPPPAPTLDAMVLRTCAMAGDRVAVVDDDRQATYRDIDAWSAAMAQRLHAKGVRRGDLVAVELPRSIEQVVAFLGIERAGAAYVPIDPEVPVARRALIYKDAAIGFAVTAPGNDLSATVELVEVGACPSPGEDSPTPPTAHGPDDLAYVLFTSGSTGRPKGIRVPHRAIVNHMAWMQRRFPLDVDDAVLQRTPAHFDASVWEFWAPLIAGARLVLHHGAHAADARAICDSLIDHAITVVQFVPSLLRLVVDEPMLDRAGSLRRVFCGGEPLSPSLAAATWARCEVELVNLYGPTEATIDATAWVCTRDDLRRARVPIGHAIDGMVAEVIDVDGRPAPVGAIGELHLCGVGVADGYIGVTADSAAFGGASPARTYATGDLARQRADGALEVLGRVDDQLKIRGNRVEPGEIEAVLVDHPDVDAAVVLPLGVDLEQTGDALVAYVVRAPQGRGRRDHDHRGTFRTDADLETAHVSQWLELYGDVYQRANPTGDGRFDIVGWDSSYDLAPIGADAMREWLDETIERILALRPRRVLEIGAGTGLIALAVAPYCESYLATDFSEAALERLCAAGDQITSLTTCRLRADEIDTLGDDPERTFDLVVLNSVVQYFPSEHYLGRVLEAAARLLSPGGRVVVGDVRNLQLLSAFHLSVAIGGAPDALPVRALGAEVRRRCQTESELVVDPRWFATLPAFDVVEVRPKATSHANELTNFRYDVIIERSSGGDAKAAALGEPVDEGPPPRVVDERSTWLEGALPELDGPAVIVGVPNRRLAAYADADRLLQRHADDDVFTLRSVLAERIRSSPGLDPYEVLEASARGGREVALLLTSASTDGSFDVLTWPSGSQRPVWRPRPVAAHSGERLINAPMDAARDARLAADLQTQAVHRLPTALVPASVIVVPELPRHPNGKLDRAALPRPDRLARDSRYVAPSSPLEEVLADVWADVLGQRRVGVTDQFFADLGGHSLLATQLIARVRELFEPSLPLRLVFEAPTVASMAIELTTKVPDADHVARVIRQVQDLSDDEVAASIARSSRDRSGR